MGEDAEKINKTFIAEKNLWDSVRMVKFNHEQGHSDTINEALRFYLKRKFKKEYHEFNEE